MLLNSLWKETCRHLTFKSMYKFQVYSKYGAIHQSSGVLNVMLKYIESKYTDGATYAKSPKKYKR